MTWDDLDLYHGHKAQETILTDVSDTIHADSLALFALNIETLLADVTKPEMSKILTLTWPVTSSVTSWSNLWPCAGSSRTGLSNGVWNLEIGPVVWEISGGGGFALPAGRVTNQTPAGRGLNYCFGCIMFVRGWRGAWKGCCFVGRVGFFMYFIRLSVRNGRLIRTLAWRGYKVVFSRVVRNALPCEIPTSHARHLINSAARRLR